MPYFDEHLFQYHNNCVQNCGNQTKNIAIFVSDNWIDSNGIYLSFINDENGNITDSIFKQKLDTKDKLDGSIRLRFSMFTGQSTVFDT